MDRNNAYARRGDQAAVNTARPLAGASRQDGAREWSAFLSLCFFLSNFRAEGDAPLAPGGREKTPIGVRHGGILGRGRR